MAERKKTMAEIREAQGKVVEQQRELGGIIPSKLKLSESVFIETVDYVYKIQRVEEDGKSMFVIDTAALAFGRDRTVLDISSIDGQTSAKMEDWIGLGMHMNLQTPNGTSVFTREVDSAIIQGDGYDVELWDK